VHYSWLKLTVAFSNFFLSDQILHIIQGNFFMGGECPVPRVGDTQTCRTTQRDNIGSAEKRKPELHTKNPSYSIRKVISRAYTTLSIRDLVRLKDIL
jgi:hypothetical protein